MPSENTTMKTHSHKTQSEETRVKSENFTDAAATVAESSQTASISVSSVPSMISDKTESTVSITPISLGPAVSVTPVVQVNVKNRGDLASAALQSSVAAESSTTSDNEGVPYNNHSVSVIKRTANIPSSISVEPFTFKTPSPVRQVRSSTSSSPVPVTAVKPSTSKAQASSTSSSKSHGANMDLSTGSQRSSFKKNPAVKIASFAKTSEGDKPSSMGPSVSSSDPKTAKHKLGRNLTSMSIKSSLQNLSAQHSSSSTSKQSTTQTSLPTPHLNAALRSYFSAGSESDASVPKNVSGASDDEEEEEILVYMQFDTKLDSDLLQANTPFKIIGVDSEKPVLQLGNQVFEGNWSDTVGTAVFFEEHPSASPGDPVFMKNPSSTLTYHSKTQKALIMSRIFIKAKDETRDCEEVDLNSHTSDGPMVPIATVEVAP